MRAALAIVSVAIGLAFGCTRESEAKTYTLKGQILAVKPETREVLVKHEDIAGFMPAMTMAYAVKDGALLKDRLREKDGTITHNLRTAVIDSSGRVVAIHDDNRWTVAQLVDELKRALGRR